MHSVYNNKQVRDKFSRNQRRAGVSGTTLCRIVFALLLLGSQLPGLAQNDWTLKKDKDGIKVYSRSSQQSKFDELKAELSLHSSLSTLASVILDVPSYKQWSFNTKQSYVLKQISPSELYFYTEINSPWPANNRDLVVHLQIQQDPRTKVMTISEVCIPNYIPPKKDIVRVPFSKELWTVTPVAPGLLKIVYQLQIDPGEGAPSWLINMFATKGPYETFKNLQEQIKQPQYQTHPLPFIQN